MFQILIRPCFIILLLVSCTRKQDKVVVAVAANVQYAMEELTSAFARETGIDCEVIVSSSGKITAQVREGAPYDVFVSADMKYPESLFADSLTINPPVVYAYGTLVLWALSEEWEPSLDILTEDVIHHIAIANPKTAPYGEAAVEALRHFGIYESIRQKLVLGESISQTNQFIESGAAEIGFTAKSVVVSPSVKGTGRWIEIDQQSYATIGQGVVVIRRTPVEEQAKKFYTFLFSKTARSILRQYGYITPEE